VCTGNPNPCTSTGSTCTGGTTCVEQHCVSPCGTNNSCAGGFTCVAGGCIPNQAPQFICNAEGLNSGCAQGSVCIHHSCYIACANEADGGASEAGATDGGAAANSCATADKFNVCKQVSTGTGTYSVCGSASNLGAECDPTQNKACASGKVCIDGYCR
jgi:hypothetical protein